MILKPVHIVCVVLICIGDLTGCGLHGTVLFFFSCFFKGHYSCYFLNKIFFTLVSSLFCFVVVSLLLSSRGELWRSTSSVS